jgi:fibronectin type 3 domain-containing protein
MCTGMVLGMPTRAASVTLAWNKNHEPDVAGYRVYFGPQGGTPTTTLDAGNATNKVVTGLQEGASYSFYATAYNSAGLESDYSAPVNYTIPSVANNLLVTWEQSFSPKAVSYSVTYGPENQAPTTRMVGTNLSATITNVSRGATYEITAYAYDSSSLPVTEYDLVTYTIPLSGSVGSVHLLPIDQPPAITLTSPSNNSAYTQPADIVISATASDDDRIQFVDFFNDTDLLARDTSAPFSFTWNSVPAGTYDLYAIAVDTSDQFTRSASAIVNVGGPSPVVNAPLAPIDISANFTPNTKNVEVSWRDVSDNESSFIVERSLNGSSFASVGLLAANQTTFTDPSVQRKTLYYYRVGAANSAGANVSSVVSVQTR